MIQSAVGFLLVLGFPPYVFCGDDYSSYFYHGIDVTAIGAPETVTKYAHDLRRIDAAAGKVFVLPFGEWRMPTHLYAVSSSEFAKLTGGDTTSMSRSSSSGYDVLILTRGDGAPSDRNFGLYYAYSLNLLLAEGAARLPYWFRTGFLEVMAASSVAGDRVTLGSFNPGRVRTLETGTLIPLRRLLALESNDPELKREDVKQMYAAECWYLVHQIVIEKLYNAEFTKYLTLIDQGGIPGEAFAQSFAVSYEDLDAALRGALKRGKIGEIRVPVPDERDAVKPETLSPSEAKGRLAWVGVRVGRDYAYASTLAKESLALDPRNGNALRALAMAQVKQGDYALALKSMDGLPDEDAGTAAPYADRASVIRAFLRATEKAPPLPGVDRADLMRRERADYDRALAIDPENLAYWSSALDLVAEQHDAEAFKALFPKAERTFYLHSRSPGLAYSLAHACAAMSDYDDALKFAVAWRNNALSAASRDDAAAYISRTSAYLQKRDVAAQPAAPAVAP
jgi:hypothetical protein